MIKNYLKVAWRNLSKNKTHTFINIAGLSVGLVCSILILLWVQNELAMDSFHKNSSRLYSVYASQYYDHKAHGTYNTPGPAAEEMKKVIPEIEYASPYAFTNPATFQAGDKILKMNGNSAGPDYFKMFSYPLIEGNAQNALKGPVAIAISRKMAVAFYGSPAAAINKTIRYNNDKSLTVTAVFEDMGANVSEKVDFITNWKVFTDDNSWALEWGNNGPSAYIMLRPDANAALVEKKITRFLDKYNNLDRKTATFIIDLALQPYSEKYLHGNFDDQGRIDGGRIAYVRLFSIVAVFILLIACINFMNLATARSVKRAKEIGVRKVVGALRSSLIQQFISESMLITFIAVAVSLVLLALLLPVFNDVTQKQIVLPFNQPGFWARLTAITLVTGLIAGSYPALFLSSFKPVKVLKGTLKLDTGTTFFRKGLVVFQFFLSIVLITATIVVSKQMSYIQSKNLGYDRENLVYVPMEGTLIQKYEVFKQEALSMPGVESVTRISNTPTNIQGSTGGINWVGKDTTVNIQFTFASVGYDFTKTMKLKMAAGRDFSKDFATDSIGYIINEAALKRIGYKDPIGQPLTMWGKKGKIIGVLRDFHFNSLHDRIRPLILRLRENEDYGNFLIRTRPGKTREALSSMEKLCKQMNPAFPFTYYFSDEEYQKLYQNEQIVSKLSDAFSFLAILISCLGLLGLAMFTAEQRVKEIGIRKVLGASVQSLYALLSREFLMLIGIALLIALPVSWYAMNKWLLGFEYHTPMQWWMFAMAGIIILFIALVTVSFQAIKAALMNPIKSLRSE
ncbi:ABC transporter permease [Mucilaginibacter ginsenosidivorans]|uniref:FtsX-like permease family protein n=1 Tax=Mucilaginibacter ginsenosidivorans TaxID=398053 RepID=A0A5B8UU66_9SPHI|nr:ABC transporter permease [Mucilaginibacter ginsenosidivorans]QEC62660.1 FtsX-like permease family protein [Mucilaginibacter ginsenosidivorans]